MKIKIVTDSTSYLPQHLRDEYDISVVSLGVTIDTETYREEEIDNATFYTKMAQAKAIPTSSQPPPQEFYNVFEKLVLNGHAVVGIFLSGAMSGTVSTANLAKKMILERHPHAVIEILDSQSNCMELGLPVLAAARVAKGGAGIDEVIKQAKFVMARSRFLFLPNTLAYLQKGGRIGGAAALLGSLLQIRPILTVIDGKADVFKKVRKRERALQEMIDTFLSDVKQKGLGEAVIHHINCEAEALKLAQQLKEQVGTHLPVCPIGPVIGLHVGPGTIGIVYYTQAQN
ncbi:DegV family protein [Peptococcaceae bacterium 1198_IL3148]